MKYYSSKEIKNIDFAEAIQQVTDALKEEGFGVLTEIDVKKTLKEKIDVDFKPYMILGACSPQFAHKALQAEDKIGTMLPCNVIVQQKYPETVEIAVVDPVASMQAVDNTDLENIATEVRNKLEAVLLRL